MVTSARYDTTCPSCNHTFEVEETLSEGNCPSCGVHLRFLEEAPPPPPDMPALQPEAEPSRTLASAPEPANGDGGFAVQCPRCTRSFSVAVDATHGICPECSADLRFEDQYPRAIESFTIRCPSCGATSDVPPDARALTCAHCGAGLRLEDVFPGQEALLESAPAPAPPPSPAPQADERRGHFRRFTQERRAPPPAPAVEEPAVTEPQPAPALRPDQPPPVRPAPPEGLPYVLSCPTCQREFSVSPKEHEGNCPHCNAPLAFLTEKEYDALLEAEERKRAFQAKLQQKRLERKKREEERLGREAAVAPPRDLLKRLRPGKKTPEGPKPAEAPTEPAPPALTPLEPPKRKLRLPWGKKPAAPGEPTPAAATPETGVAPTLQPEPPVAPAPAAPATKKGKAKKAPEAAPPAVETEIAIAEPAPSPATPAREPKKGLLSRFTRKAPAPPSAAPETIETAQTPSAPSSANVEVAGLDVGTIEVAAATPPAEAAPKKGLLGRFARKRKAPPTPPAETAVQSTEIDVGDVIAAPTSPAPVAEPKKGRAKKTAKAPVAPAPAVEAPAAIEFESSLDVPAASPSAPAPKKGFLSRFKREKAPAGPAAVVEEGDIEIGNGMEAATASAASIDIAAQSAPAPKKRRK